MTDKYVRVAQAALYCLILGPVHIVLLPIAWSMDGRDGADTVVRRFWRGYPGGSDE